MERVPPPRLLFSQFTLSLDRWRVQGGLIMLYGDHAVLGYSLRAIASLLARGEHVVFIDSANAFNPFLIAEVATRLNRRPEELLECIHVSRTFTVHQLEALIAERASSALKAHASRVLIASGFLDNLYDEDVELREAWRVFRKAMTHLRALADSGALVLVVCPAPAARGEPSRTMRLRDRDGMLDALIAEADKVVKLEASALYLEKSVRAADAFPRSRTPARGAPRGGSSG